MAVVRLRFYMTKLPEVWVCIRCSSLSLSPYRWNDLLSTQEDTMDTPTTECWSMPLECATGVCVCFSKLIYGPFRWSNRFLVTLQHVPLSISSPLTLEWRTLWSPARQTGWIGVWESETSLTDDLLVLSLTWHLFFLLINNLLVLGSTAWE